MSKRLLPSRSFRRLCLLAMFGGWMLRLGVPSVLGAAALYQEPAELRWGSAQVLRNGVFSTVDTWYSERPLTFAENGFFDARQRLCLSNAFQVTTGLVNQVRVWCLNSTSSTAFRERALADRCVTGSTFTVGPAPASPDSPSAGPVAWTFRLRTEGSAAPLPTTLELALLVDEVPAGTAWQVPLEDALVDPGVREVAKLSADDEARVRGSATWATIYLVAQGTLREGAFPAVVKVPDLPVVRVPVAFGLRSLAAIPPEFARDRSISVANRALLVQRLSPDRPTAFAGASDWFVQTPSSLDRLSLGPGQLNLEQHLEALVNVFNRPAGNQAFNSPRVREASDWAVRAGPFLRLQSAVARVTAMKGWTEPVPVERLQASFSEETHFAKATNEIQKIEGKLSAKLAQHAAAPGEYFWLPNVIRPHLESVRALENVRYTDQLVTSFDTNRFVYSKTYTPVPITGKIGVSYNPEEGFGGQAVGGWTNWWSPGDAFRVSAKIAERKVEGEVSYQFRYYRSLDGKTQLHAELLGLSGTDEHYRLGGLSDQPFRHQYRQGGVEHRLHHDGGTWEVSIADAFLWDSHELDQPEVTGSGLRLEDEGLIWNHRQAWVFRPDPSADAVRVWRYSVAPEMTLGPDVGWQGSFWVGQLTAAVRMDFGGESREDMFVSLRGTIGAATGDAPPTYLFRVGDQDRLVGLEPGEYSGRSLAHAELVYGIALQRLFGRLFAKPSDDKGQVEKNEGGGPGFLAGLRLVALAEVGALSRSSDLGAVRDPDEVVSSFGAALEKEAPGLRGPAFRLGYGWSPDSLRTGGRLFTTMSWAF